MRSLDIENLTREVIREIVLERFFPLESEVAKLSESNHDLDDQDLQDLKNQLEISSSLKTPTYTWEKSNRKVLLDIPVGNSKYLSFPRNIKRSKFRQKWKRAAWSLKRAYGAKYKFTNTLTSIRAERLA